ncbi:DUF1127 domain-containing protein [Roseicyclus sp.]|uniref:DUF1127 domain-containing protein n=1 Tax=Roseicyclus sp. TaxID=1914329 RepID=UPI003F6D4036
MAYVTSNRTISNGMGLGARLTEIGKDIIAAWRAHRVYRETLTELQALSTRELADLGLNPSMLRNIALEAAYGKRG